MFTHFQYLPPDSRLPYMYARLLEEECKLAWPSINKLINTNRLLASGMHCCSNIAKSPAIHGTYSAQDTDCSKLNRNYTATILWDQAAESSNFGCDTWSKAELLDDLHGKYGTWQRTLSLKVIQGPLQPCISLFAEVSCVSAQVGHPSQQGRRHGAQLWAQMASWSSSTCNTENNGYVGGECNWSKSFHIELEILVII